MHRYLCKPFFCKKRSQNKIAIDNYAEEIYSAALDKSILNSFKFYLKKL